MLTDFFLFGKMMSLLWQIWYIIGLIFIVANGQILKNDLNIWSHWWGWTVSNRFWRSWRGCCRPGCQGRGPPSGWQRTDLESRPWSWERPMRSGTSIIKLILLDQPATLKHSSSNFYLINQMSLPQENWQLVQHVGNFVKLIQACVIHCVKLGRVGRFFMTCVKCRKLENSLSHCVLCSPCERSLSTISLSNS